MAVQAVAVTADATVQDVPAGGLTKLFGWSIQENAGSPAVAAFLIRAGSGGVIHGGASLAASGSSTVWFGPNGVDVYGDIYFDLTAGSVTGAVYVG